MHPKSTVPSQKPVTSSRFFLLDTILNICFHSTEWLRFYQRHGISSSRKLTSSSACCLLKIPKKSGKQKKFTLSLQCQKTGYKSYVIRASQHFKHPFSFHRSPRGLVGSVWLIRRKAKGFGSQARHQNKMRKIFFRCFPLSRFLAKILRVNKKCHEKFLKKSFVYVYAATCV